MPVDGTRQELRFLEQLLLVVFAEVEMGGRGLMEGEDVVCWFQLGDCY